MEATAQVEPYAAFPLAAVKAHIDKLDLRALSKALPRTDIAGEMAVTVSDLL